MKFLLDFLERHDRKRVIMDRESKEPYLERYYLFLKDRKKFPFNVFLHKFLRSDPDDLHDHPWPYATLILKGGYWEWVPVFAESGDQPEFPIKEIIGEQKIWRGPGHFRICNATSYHRIEVEPGVDCWTLFMPGPKQRDWGFLSKGKWIQWEQYLVKRKANVAQ